MPRKIRKVNRTFGRDTVGTFAHFTQPFEIINIELRRHVLRSIYNPWRSTRSDKDYGEEKDKQTNGECLAAWTSSSSVRRLVSTRRKTPMIFQRFSSREEDPSKSILVSFIDRDSSFVDPKCSEDFLRIRTMAPLWILDIEMHIRHCSFW